MKIIKCILQKLAQWFREPDFNRERFEKLESKKSIHKGDF
jgi:hypothetical protein